LESQFLDFANSMFQTYQCTMFQTYQCTMFQTYQCTRIRQRIFGWPVAMKWYDGFRYFIAPMFGWHGQLSAR
ncbi:MAG: hypothetical protein AAFN77_14800, partial [Planctomycetota bacterium]